jgi:hypothetical protein
MRGISEGRNISVQPDLSGADLFNAYSFLSLGTLMIDIDAGSAAIEIL